MSSDIDILCDMWLTCREYITQKDRQAAADHIINVVADHNVTDDDLRALGGTDAYLKRAVQEYLGENEEDEDPYDDSLEEDDF